MSELSIAVTKEMVISVVGPTATGKTKFALKLADQLITEQNIPVVTLISADSRQIYTDLEILSGADIPADFNPITYQKTWELEPSRFFEKKVGKARIELHGVSCLNPKREWSLAHFQRFAHASIKKTWNAGGVPIIVGGTGLYHTRLFSAELQDVAGPNQELRSQLSDKSLGELQQLVRQQSSEKFEEMTISDQHNRRRLIRALEQLDNNGIAVTPYELVVPQQHRLLGIKDSIESIESRIKSRVHKRIEQGAIQEVEQLLNSFSVERKLAVFSATGVKEIIGYLSQKITKEQLEELWFRRERQYAKRQLTWWKKHQNVEWILY